MKNKNLKVMQILQKINKQLNKFTLKNIISTADDIMLDTYNELETKYYGKLSGISTGFNDLDILLGGLQKGNLIVIASKPAMGRTSFALNIAQHVAFRENLPTIIFSLALQNNRLMRMIFSSEAEIATERLQFGCMQPQDWEKLAQVMNLINGAPLYIDDNANLTFEDICKKSKYLKRKIKHIGLIVIDNLQLLENFTCKSEQMQYLSEILNALKYLAKELDVPIILLSCIPEGKNPKRNNKPKFSDLKEAELLDKYADIVLFIHRNLKRSAEIIIANSKNGIFGECELYFSGKFGKFKNI